MLRIVLVTAFLAVCVHAGVISEREKRSPQDGGGFGGNNNNNNGGGGQKVPSEMTKPFIAFANKDSAKVNAQTAANWQDKAAQGRVIESAGDRVEQTGKQNAVKVEQANQKAVMKALDDVDKAQDDAGTMLNGGGDNNNNGGNNNRGGNANGGM